MSAKDYIRERFMPHIWCAGCGHGIVFNNLIRAIEKLDLNKNDIVMVTGIGCSARISGYLDFHTLHTLHGRALAFATGVKIARPELHIIVPMGDGDATAIGGNHFIHAARRNIDITAIIMNNSIYGMTGGQYSSLSEPGTLATTAPFGNIDQAFDIVHLAGGSGATFVARTTTYHVTSMIKILEKAIMHKGFSVVEILSQCPVSYGKMVDMRRASDFLKFYRDQSVRVHKAKEMSAEELEGKIVVGKLVERGRTEFATSLRRINERFREG